MTRAEHMEWAKKRALAYLNAGDLTNALMSMISDLDKHPETAGHAASQMGVMLVMNGGLRTKEEMRKYIEGFN